MLKCHRYLGLSIALAVVVAGVSGSILAFDPELDALLNPEFFRIDEVGEGTLSPAEIARRVEESDHRIWARYIPLSDSASKAIVVYVDPRTDPTTGQKFDVSYDEVFVNPVSGKVTGNRMWGQCCERRNFVPFVFKLHNRLLMPSGIGRPIMGAIAIAWVLMTILGICLSIPARQPVVRGLLSSLFPRRGNAGKFSDLQLHRAAGLWFSVVFLVVALSGAAIALDHQLFRPLVGAVSSISPTVWEERGATATGEVIAARISFDDALAVAERHAESVRLGKVASEITYSDYRGMYRVGFGNRLQAGPGISEIYVDAQTGSVEGSAFAGRGTAGEVLNLAVQPLHSGRILGMPGRVIVFLSGIVVSALVWFGILIWLRKRRQGR